MGAFQGSEARVVLELTRFRLVDGWGAHRKGIAGKRRKSICPAEVLEYILEILSRKRQKIGEKTCFRSAFSADPA